VTLRSYLTDGAFLVQQDRETFRRGAEERTLIMSETD